MLCCVPGCKNDNTCSPESQGITFHMFPDEPTLRSAWIEALGKESSEIQETSVVCSDHFLHDDINETMNGVRTIIRPGAVPITLQVCRICLGVGSKMFPMKEYRLDEAYEHLTGYSACTDDRYPQKLCVECSQRLVNCFNFKIKSLRANSLLTEVLKNHDIITVKNLEGIPRDNNRLSSTLAVKAYNPNHCDVHVVKDVTADAVKTSKPKQNSSIKNEVVNIEICFNEYGDDYPIEPIESSIEPIENAEVKHEDYGDVYPIDKIERIVKNEMLGDDYMIEIIQSPIENIGNAQVKRESNDVKTDSDIDSGSTDDELTKNVLRRRFLDRKVKREKEIVKRKKRVEQKVPKVDRRKKLSEDLSEALFTITNLTIEEQVAEIDKRKDSANYKNAVFKCEECYKGFLNEDTYNSHMSKHTNECGESRCHICKTYFKNAHALRKHVNGQHARRFNCKQCPFTTTHRESAKLHGRWHNGTKYTCPHCPNEFFKFTSYMSHKRIKHPSDFVCQLCGYSFVSEKGIFLHKRRKHRQDIQIPADGPFCEQCNVRFVDAAALKRHISVSARHSNAERNARAPNNPLKGTRLKRDRESRPQKDDDIKPCQSQVRRAEEPITCEQCGVQLENSRAYHGHFKRMHPDKNRTKYPTMKTPCMCELCGRIFQHMGLLKDHMWVHTGEKPFKCDRCDKSFTHKTSLVFHMKVHSATPPTYGCPVCGKHFSFFNNRQRHMLIHTGLKSFKCDTCGKCFRTAGEQRAHSEHVHLKKPWPKRAQAQRHQRDLAPWQKDALGHED